MARFTKTGSGQGLIRGSETSHPVTSAYSGSSFSPATCRHRASTASCSRGGFNQHALTMTTRSLRPLPVAYGKVFSQSYERKLSSDPVQHPS